MGEVKQGTVILAPDGSRTKVTNIFPQGQKDIFRIYFSDKTYTECCDEHLAYFGHLRFQCGLAFLHEFLAGASADVHEGV